MSDHIIRAITADGSVKAVAITGRDLVERARTIHTPVSYTHLYVVDRLVCIWRNRPQG